MEDTNKKEGITFLVCPHCKESIQKGSEKENYFIDRHFDNCKEKPRLIELDILKVLQAIYLELSTSSIGIVDRRKQIHDKAYKLYEETLRNQ